MLNSKGNHYTALLVIIGLLLLGAGALFTYSVVEKQRVNMSSAFVKNNPADTNSTIEKSIENTAIPMVPAVEKQTKDADVPALVEKPANTDLKSKIYSSSKYHFSFNYSQDWIVKSLDRTDYRGSDIALVYKQGARLDGGYPADDNYIMIYTVLNPKNFSLQQLYENDYIQCGTPGEGACPAEGDWPKNWKQITIDGVKAWRSGKVGVAVGDPGYFLVLQRNGYYLQIALALQDIKTEEEYVQVFDQIQSTFKFN